MIISLNDSRFFLQSRLKALISKILDKICVFKESQKRIKHYWIENRES